MALHANVPNASDRDDSHAHHHDGLVTQVRSATWLSALILNYEKWTFCRPNIRAGTDCHAHMSKHDSAFVA